MNKRSRQQQRAVRMVCTALVFRDGHSPSLIYNHVGWAIAQHVRIGIESVAKVRKIDYDKRYQLESVRGGDMPRDCMAFVQVTNRAR